METAYGRSFKELPLDLLIIVVAGAIVLVVGLFIRWVIGVVRGEKLSTEPVGPGPLRDPEDPEEQFVSDGLWWSVETWPSLFPAWYFRDQEGSNGVGFFIFFGFPLMVICRLLDRRMKVCVYRGRRRGPWMRLIHVEFYDTADNAEARQLEILTDWQSQRFVNLPVLGLADVRRLRRNRPAG